MTPVTKFTSTKLSTAIIEGYERHVFVELNQFRLLLWQLPTSLMTCIKSCNIKENLLLTVVFPLIMGWSVVSRLVKGLALLAMYPFLVMMVMMLRYNNIFYRMFYSECDDDLTYLITSQFGSDYTLHSFGFLGLIKLYIADNEKEYHCFNCLKSVKILAE